MMPPMKMPPMGMPGQAMGAMSYAPYMGQLFHLLQGVMPTQQLLHSYHTQAEMDPALKNLPSMARFADASLHCLHAMVAAAGYAQRYMGGEMTETVLRGLREQIRTALRTHGEAKTAFGEMQQADIVRRSEVMQALGHMLQMTDHTIQAIRAGTQPLLVEPPAAPAPPPRSPS